MYSARGLKLPVTETPNEFTEQIDVASPSEIVRILRSCDAQMFSGWNKFSGLADADMLEELIVVCEQVAALFNKDYRQDECAVVMTGCGTSGRIAFLTSKIFNNALQQLNSPVTSVFHYLSSGGDEALILSKELPEDDPSLGARELEELTRAHRRVIYIGITCGLSAPYVAGQVDFCRQHPEKYTTVLMGFNPVELARDAPIEGWEGRSCRKIFTELYEHSAQELESKCQPLDRRSILLNPIVGPEPITGSTRMKGGSTTKILLDVIMTIALGKVFSLPHLVPPDCSHSSSSSSSTRQSNSNSDQTQNPITVSHARTLLREYEQAYLSAYVQLEEIATVMQAAGHALSNGRHLYYLGDEVEGLLGMIDASEMVDTYGAAYEDVQGFVSGGWTSVGNSEGDISAQSPYLHISLAEFRQEIQPKLTAEDVVVVIVSEGHLSSDLLDTVAGCAGSKLFVLHFHCGSTLADTLAPLLPPSSTIIPISSDTQTLLSTSASSILNGPRQFTIKLCLNTISTGAQVLNGTVYQNRMINVGPSNNKLYHRVIHMVALFSHVSDDEAETCLLRAVYELESTQVPDEIRKAPISQHITVATPKRKLLSVAVLLATQLSANPAQAMEKLHGEPVLRKLLLHITTSNTNAVAT